MPVVAEGFEISLWAKEPLVRNPCSIAFDAHGRMCVGMGPQYRKPTPQTPGDSVFIVEDKDGDGTSVCDRVQLHLVARVAWTQPVGRQLAGPDHRPRPGWR